MYSCGLWYMYISLSITFFFYIQIN